MPDGVVEQDGDLAGGRRNRLLLSDPRRETTIEGAQSGVAASDGCGGLCRIAIQIELPEQQLGVENPVHFGSPDAFAGSKSGILKTDDTSHSVLQTTCSGQPEKCCDDFKRTNDKAPEELCRALRVKGGVFYGHLDRPRVISPPVAKIKRCKSFRNGQYLHAEMHPLHGFETRRQHARQCWQRARERCCSARSNRSSQALGKHAAFDVYRCRPGDTDPDRTGQERR